MATGTVDSHLTQVSEDLGVLGELVRAVEGPELNSDRKSYAIAIYLVANRRLIDRAVEAWAETQEHELHELEERTVELDFSATHHSFLSIATAALVDAHEVLVHPSTRAFFRTSDDNLHMLDRMIRFAKYLVDTEDFSVAWHPVRELLALSELPVDKARDQALAVPPSPTWGHRVSAVPASEQPLRSQTADPSEPPTPS